MTKLDTSTQDADKIAADKILGALQLPSSIEKVEVRLGRDSTGDPAMWVILWVDPALSFSTESFEPLHRFAEEVQTSMLHAPLQRFPYVVLEQAA